MKDTGVRQGTLALMVLKTAKTQDLK